MNIIQSPKLENLGLQGIVVQHPIGINRQALTDFALRDAIAVVAAEQSQIAPDQRAAFIGLINSVGSVVALFANIIFGTLSIMSQYRWKNPPFTA